MSSQPSIRLAGPADLERVAWLETESFADPWPIDLLLPELERPSSLVLMAAEPGRPPGGYACFRIAGGTDGEAEEAELLRIGVEPASRRRGLARSLLAQGLALLRDRGVHTCYLEVRLDNLGAIALYRAFGFSLIGLRRAYYRDGCDALVYSLALRAAGGRPEVS